MNAWLKGGLIKLSIVLFVINFVNAAPAPWGFALNHKTKQCINFWPGDEFSQNKLPEGFEFYWDKSYNKETGSLTYITSVGNCTIKEGVQTSNNFSECCKQLNYQFISDNEDISKKSINRKDYITIIISLIVVLLLVGLAVRLFKNRKSKKRAKLK